MDNPLHGQYRPIAGQLRVPDHQLSPDTGQRAFLYRQGSVGTVESEPSDTSGLPE